MARYAAQNQGSTPETPNPEQAAIAGIDSGLDPNVLLGNNRYTANRTTEENDSEANRDRILLSIMQEEFPSDIFYSQGRLTPGLEAEQAREALNPNRQDRKKEKVFTKRNPEGVAQFEARKEIYERYTLTKAYPTIDEEDLDEIIDEEWQVFKDPVEEEEVPIVKRKRTGLFLTTTDFRKDDPHHLYITRGPQTLDGESVDIEGIFCVFYILNGRARPIPNYKTLEVMLAERGSRYDIIRTASSQEISEYDMKLDGQDTQQIYGAGDPEYEGVEEYATAYGEYLDRAMPDRTREWSDEIRFRSGYRPVRPFVRDPGDYIKTESQRRTGGRIPEDEEGNPLPADILAEHDPDDFYTDQVFLRQTYREQMREKYEGKIVIARFPAPYDNPSEVSEDDPPPGPTEIASDEEVRRGTEIRSDDYVNGVRFMMLGHWKQVRSNPALRLYATKQGIDLARYEPQTTITGADGQPLGFDEAFEAGEGRYGRIGLINLIREAGGIDVLEHTNDDPHPVWVTFPQIVEADTDGIPGMDLDEYIEYLDYYSNGGRPFSNEFLEPYEPPGSIKYYNVEAYQDLVQQAILQEQIDIIKDQILELFPSLAAKIETMKIEFDSLPTNYIDYCNKLLGDGGPLYQLFFSKDGKWKYKKKRGWPHKDIKTKDDSKAFFTLLKRLHRFRANLNEDEENNIVKKDNHKWMRTVARDKFASWMNQGGGFDVSNTPVEGPLAPEIQKARDAADNAFTSFDLTPVALTISFAATIALASPIGFIAGLTFAIVDVLMGEVPDGKYKYPPWRFMKDNWYVKACIYRGNEETMNDLFSRSAQADAYMPWLRETINKLNSQMFMIDEMLATATSVEDFNRIFDGLMAMQNLFGVLETGGLLDYVQDLRADIDTFVADQLKRQYNAIQYIRKKCHNKVGNQKKFFITWPRGPQEVLNEYVPGLTFDNYLRK